MLLMKPPESLKWWILTVRRKSPRRRARGNGKLGGIRFWANGPERSSLFGSYCFKIKNIYTYYCGGQEFMELLPWNVVQVMMQPRGNAIHSVQGELFTPPVGTTNQRPHFAKRYRQLANDNAEIQSRPKTFLHSGRRDGCPSTFARFIETSPDFSRNAAWKFIIAEMSWWLFPK